MKFFIDTADVNEIREAASWGLVDGVTTNPSLIAKTGRRVMEILQLDFDPYANDPGHWGASLVNLAELLGERP